jgi:hypothetical protein
VAHRRDRLAGDERGQAVLFLIVVVPLLMLLIVLIVDGGRMFYEYVKVHNVAALSAQAGAQAVNTGYFRETNEVILNIDGAIFLEQQAFTLNAGRLPGATHVWYFPTTAEGRICIQERIPTFFWGFFGRPEVAPAACSRARPRYGIEREWQ